MDPSIDVGVVYGACRERIAQLVRDLGPEQAQTRIPACPDWTVHDLVAHLAGTVTDVAAGKLDGVGTDEWTAAQVEARRDTPIPDLLAEWDGAAPQFEEGLRLIGGTMAALAVADVWNHEQDLRGALDADGGADPAAEITAVEGYLPRVGAGLAANGLAPLRCRAGAQEIVSGDGEPGATLTAEPFEIARAIAGRRTADQLAAYHWDGDAQPYIAALAAGGPTAPLPR
jgi:uncharacterized protein (TIGR03083 family)